MLNGLREPQTIVLLGGTSDIGRAIVHEVASDATTHIVLGVRDPASVDTSEFAGAGREVIVEPFDAVATSDHDRFLTRVAEQVGDIDLVVMAWGMLGSQAEFDADPDLAVVAASTNYVGVVSMGLRVAALMRTQGHGSIAVLSSVAGERVRADNFVYGSTKAGADGFGQGLADALVGSGVDVTVIRPGFVHSSMTEGLEPAPFATTPNEVARRAADAIRNRTSTVWAPGALRYVFMVLRHLPRAIFRRLS